MRRDYKTSNLVKQTTIEFYGMTLNAVATDDDAKLYVSLRQLCSSLGLNYSGELRRIRAMTVLTEGLRILAASTPDRRSRQTACLRVDLMPGWLIGVNCGRIKGKALCQKVKAYQRELCQVAWQVFGPEPATTPITELELTTLVRRVESVSQRLEAIAQIVALLAKQGKIPPTPGAQGDPAAEPETGANREG